MNTTIPNNNRSVSRLVPLALLALVLLVLAGAVLMSKRQQPTLPMTGLQSNRQIMPPDPGDWCRKVVIAELDAEVARAEVYFNEGVGRGLVDFDYLALALKRTGVQVNGPVDEFWLDTIKSLYAGCPR
jgi:hypothetical protein